MNPSRSIIVVILFACFATVSFASSPVSQHQSALDSVISKIKSLKADIFSEQSKYDDLHRQIENTEIQIGKIVNKIHTTRSKLTSQQKLLHSIELKQKNNQYTLHRQINLLQEQIRSAYMLGHEPYLKLLLNQQNPQKISQQLQYYQYINQARLQVIASIKVLLMKINETTAAIKEKTETLNETYNEQRKQQQDLNNTEKRREILMQETHLKIRSNNTKLAQLYEDKNRLEKIIAQLNREKTLAYTSNKPFELMKRKLIWPVHGKISQYFGQPLSQGRLKGTGLLIQAQAGTPVKAIFQGKVVFADWLRGFGLLTIIQHGEYLTLYGRNQGLFVKTGDIIESGETIGTVGKSGGYEKSALYFEIRRKGIPVNPVLWLRKRVA